MSAFSGASDVNCPCGGMLSAWQVYYASMGLITDWTYRCLRCGTTVAVSVHSGMDPAAEVAAAVGTHPLFKVPDLEPHAPVEPPPLISGSVIGYRAWRIVDWQLTGTGVNRSWGPGVNEATCDAGPGGWTAYGGHRHAAPSPGCHCGITALARFTEKDEHWQKVDVFGAIEAWGENEAAVEEVKPGDVAAELAVIEKPPTEHSGFHLHRNGFRARYGKVVLLAVEDDWPVAKKAAVRALAAEHEADICKRAHLEDAAKEHGQLVPDDLLEWVAKSEPTSPAEEIWSYPLYTSYVQKAMMQQQQLSNSWAQSIQSIASGLQALGGWTTIASSSSSGSGYARQKNKPRKPGISQTLGYPGPPANPTVKSSKGQRVADSKANVWVCVKGGKPGLWEREE